MLTISKVFTSLCNSACVGIGIPWYLSKQTSKLFFPMSVQVYSIPCQTEGRTKNFSEWKSIDLSYELSLTYRGNVNYYKSVNHSIPTHENRRHPIAK